jgi:hypothetical protein
MYEEAKHTRTYIEEFSSLIESAEVQAENCVMLQCKKLNMDSFDNLLSM